MQALTLLNDAVFVECAQALGKRIVEEKPNANVAERARHAFRIVLGRVPGEAEVARLAKLHDELLTLCQSNPAEAKKLVGSYQPGGATAIEAAVWMALSRTLLNLDEVVTRE